MARRDNPQRQWSDLPLDVVELISMKIADIVDFVHFRCVCKPWRSAAKPQNLSRQQLPWLVLPCDRKSSARPFFRLSTRSIITLDLPETRNRIICGSSNGWLLLLGHFLKFSLFNPLTRALINLPPITAFPPGFARVHNRLTRNGTKIPFEETTFHFRCDPFVSSDPNSAALIDGAVIFANPSMIQYWKAGDGEWSVFVSGLQDHPSEIAFHKGKIYAISRHGNVAVGDVGSPGKGVVVPSLKLRSPCGYLLLALPEELLLVTHRTGIFPFNVHGFCSGNFVCYKLEESEGRMSWSRLEGFGGHTVFLTIQRRSYQDKLAGAGVVLGAPGFKGNCFYYVVLRRYGRRRVVLVLEQDEYLDGVSSRDLQGCLSIIPSLY